MQLGGRLGTDKRDPVIPDDPRIGPTDPDEASLVGAKFSEPAWGEASGARVKGPPSGEDEPLAGASNVARVPDVGLEPEVERSGAGDAPSTRLSKPRSPRFIGTDPSWPGLRWYLSTSARPSGFWLSPFIDDS